MKGNMVLLKGTLAFSKAQDLSTKARGSRTTVSISLWCSQACLARDYMSLCVDMCTLGSQAFLPRPTCLGQPLQS